MIRELAAIIRGEDVLALGYRPCSSDSNEEAVLEYAHRLADLQQKVADKIFIIMRVLYSQASDQWGRSVNVKAINGLKRQCTSFITRVITETGLTTADENTLSF